MLRLASRLDGVVSRLETQHKMNMVNKNMSVIVKSLEQSLKDNNLEKVSENMDQFERQFENLDVQTEFVEQAMGNTTAATTPPAGPESTVCTGFSRALSRLMSPPAASITITGRSSPMPSPFSGSCRMLESVRR